jgi:hypothetical protein
MPRLTFEVPDSEYARLEDRARDEGVSVRMWVVWLIKAHADLPLPPKPSAKPEEPAAA